MDLVGPKSVLVDGPGRNTNTIKPGLVTGIKQKVKQVNKFLLGQARNCCCSCNLDFLSSVLVMLVLSCGCNAVSP